MGYGYFFWHFDASLEIDLNEKDFLDTLYIKELGENNSYTF
jgi:hypothetical protein